MTSTIPRRRGRLLLAAALTATLTGATASSAMAAGALYTQTNDPAGNIVQKFDRAADGSLELAGSVAYTGNATTAGRVTGYRVGADGSLAEVTSVPAAAGITGAAAA